MYSKLKCIHVIFFLIVFHQGYGQFSIDYSFGSGGEYHDNDQINEGPFDIIDFIELPSKELLVYGNKKLSATFGSKADIMLVKLNEDGSTDLDFATNGIFRYGFENQFNRIEKAIVFDDGKILIAGAASISGNMHGFILKLNSDGSLDNGFQTGGILIMPSLVNNGQESITDILIKSSGIYIAYNKGHSVYPARSYALLAKLDLEGNVDESFGVNGFLEFPTESEEYAHDFFKLIPTKNNKVLALLGLGTQGQLELYRCNTDGTIDDEFSDNGKFNFTGNPKSIVSTADYKLILPINSPTGTIVIGLDDDGHYDPDFGLNGIAEIDSKDLNSVYIYPDGSLLFAGTTALQMGNGFAGLIKLTKQGDLDLSFSSNGTQIISADPSAGANEVIKPSVVGNRFYVLSKQLLFPQLVIVSSLCRIDESITSNIYSLSGEDKLRVYPNPFSNQLKIKDSSFESPPQLLEVYDSSGKLVFKTPYKSEINLITLPPSTYILKTKFLNGKENMTRVIKQ